MMSDRATHSPPFPKAFFVTGTDTGVGKTVVSAILVHGLQAHYWKPVQSGGKSAGAGESINMDSIDAYTDSAFLTAAGVPPDRILPERYRLSQPLSPHLSAKLDGVQIRVEDFTLPDTTAMKHVIVEGAGGLLVPLNDKEKIIDLISHLDIPVLLVARSGLGTINHTLLSLEALRSRNISILGVVMVGEFNTENRNAIEMFGKVDVIGEVPVLKELNRNTMLDCFENNFHGGRSRNARETNDDLASIHADAYCRSTT